MERYQRLRVEVSEFENDLRALEAITMSEKEKEIKLIDGFLPKVKNGISDLLKQLSNLEGKPKLGPVAVVAPWFVKYACFSKRFVNKYQD